MKISTHPPKLYQRSSKSALIESSSSSSSSNNIINYATFLSPNELTSQDTLVNVSSEYTRGCHDDINIENESTPLITEDDDKKYSKHSSSPSAYKGKATYFQSTVNTINLMVGMSLISLPFTLKTGGWIPGIGLIVGLGLITLYTAFLLVKCMERFPNVFNLGDLGHAVYGDKGRWIISALYVFELISCGVGYCIVVGDSLYALFHGNNGSIIGSWGIFEWKLAAIAVMIGSSLVESVTIQFLSSVSGILASILLLLITIYDGFSTPNAPGSVWDPADTRLFPINWSDTLINLGLVIFTYSGHSVIPVIFKEMQEPRHFKSMVTFSWNFIMLWLLGVPILTYRMFGSDLKDEFTLNLWETESYNKPLNGMLLWLIIVVSTSKYSLVMSPVAQVFLPKGSTVSSGGDTHGLPQSPSSSSDVHPLVTSKRLFVCCGLGTLVFLIAFLMPEFSQVIGFVGAILSFIITMIFPCMCHLHLFGENISIPERLLNYVLIALGMVGGLLGSYGCLVKMQQSSSSSSSMTTMFYFH